MGRERLNVSEPHHQVVVVEDAAAGVRAGKSAGATVIAVLETHSREALEAAGADHIVSGLDQVRIRQGENGKMVLEL